MRLAATSCSQRGPSRNSTSSSAPKATRESRLVMGRICWASTARESPSLRFSLSASYSAESAPKAKRQLFDTSITPIKSDTSSTPASMLSPNEGTPIASTQTLPPTARPSCNSQGATPNGSLHSSHAAITTTRRHSYNTRSQPNLLSALHPPESSGSMNKG